MYTSNQKGICPICGNKEIFYENFITNELLDNEGYRDWFCFKCGSKGEEWYKMQFTTHGCVRDDNNKFVTKEE